MAPGPQPHRPALVRLVVIGLVGGLMAGLFGVGGGLLMVPLLITFAGLDQRRAAAASLLAIVPTSVVGATGYALRGEVDVPVAALVAVGGVVGAHLGARLMRVLPRPWLRWMFITLLVAVAAYMAFVEPARGTQIDLTPGSGAGLLATGVVMGVTAGLFGVGGGLITVPALIVLFGAGDLVAKGTSLLVIVPTAIAGTWANHRGGQLDVRTGLVVGGCGTLASFGGVELAFLVPAHLSGVLFAALVMTSAVQLTIRTLRRRRRG
ncbi:permease [Cellulomonas bogoriensis 69B4 = DSM 16987]|uniref:Probable membrane transporter protein n=1 Tax=Cellulomonas bogoriensis 69B4 = DSM 16987 TaxID=1386082 RepID=A0A0A0BQ88_9CELL|nr:sulfite exporter TauE/SafE family protein [Cellulomonas bogoriensis]KGM10136.1 permease [Cellulomonas bogoriensis 69B4 = DSM 16987]